MSLPPPYTQLTEELRRLGYLGSVSALLGWDEQVNLPSGSAEFRAQQNAILSDLSFRETTRSELGEMIAAAEGITDELEPPQQAVVREARIDYDKVVKLTPDFIKRRAVAQSHAFHAWVKAREADDFGAFRDYLKEQMDLAVEYATLTGHSDKPYDFLIGEFDPGMTGDTVDTLFAALKSDLVPIVEEIINSPVQADTSMLKGFTQDKQERFLREVVAKLGFNFEEGRLDRSVHPFCGGSGQDTRMTTRFLEDLPLSSLFGSVHETGHGLYEQGLPKEHFGTALGESVGMAVHESQSRMWENQVGRGRAFWKFWEPRYREIFASELNHVSSDALYLAINAVGVSPIRVESDEVTYNLHIMLRFAMEKQLIEGTISVDDAPDAWNALSEELLGFVPQSNANGIMQDVHWSAGLFGYFPSYCLGNILAAQLWYTLLDQLPGLENDFEQGEFGRLLDWLRTNVHHLGKQFYTQDLAQRITGEPLNTDHLIRYLRERYLPLYT